MKGLGRLWFGEIPQPNEWKFDRQELTIRDEVLDHLESIADRRNRIKYKIDQYNPQTNQDHNDSYDLKPLQADLAYYLQLVHGLSSIQHELPPRSSLELWHWKHSAISSTSSEQIHHIDFELSMATLTLACVHALEAEQLSQINEPASVVKEAWRRAAGYFKVVPQHIPQNSSLLPLLEIWQQLCTVHAHAVEMTNVEDAETSRVQLARFHSALSRGAHTACITAQASCERIPNSQLASQLRWLVISYKAISKISYWENEIKLFELKPHIAILYCDAILKSKLPIPPHYSHRLCVYFTKIMQKLVGSHLEIQNFAIDKKERFKSIFDGKVHSFESDERLQEFLKVDELRLNTLMPLELSGSIAPIVPSHRAKARNISSPLAIPEQSMLNVSKADPCHKVVECEQTTTNVRIDNTQISKRRHRHAIQTPESASRDVRVAIRAHNLGLLPESSSNVSNQPEWQYGVEPFTPRLDARQISRGFSVPAIMKDNDLTDDDDDDCTMQNRHTLSVGDLDRLVGATSKHGSTEWSSDQHGSNQVHLERVSMVDLAPPKINRKMVAMSKRKSCGLCERTFPIENLIGIVVMKRILDLRSTWGLHSVGTPKCSPASYLYRDVRVCALCSDILYGFGGALNELKESTTAQATTIHQHVKQLRRISMSAHTYKTIATKPAIVDEIGYMIHQSILNDALLLKEPSTIHKQMDVTRRRDVIATQSSVLLLGGPSNAINPLSHRGIHTHEEQAPWWEIDLGLHCDITSIEIWNCSDSDPQVAARLFPCHILLLLKPGHKRSLIELKGVAVDSTVIAAPSQPLRWRPKPGCVARHVRIVVDKLTFLHFERVHVFGTPLKDDLVVRPRPATAAKLKPTRILEMRMQQDRVARSPRPKSAGFLMPTASSNRRTALGHEIRQQVLAESRNGAID